MLSLDQIHTVNHDESGIIDQELFNYYELLANQGMQIFSYIFDCSKTQTVNLSIFEIIDVTC